jgi:hypothetical protein
MQFGITQSITLFFGRWQSLFLEPESILQPITAW